MPPVVVRLKCTGSYLHGLFARLKQGLAAAETSAMREHALSLRGYRS
ncbi:hypothetical protein ACIQM0_33085 [Streptomyces sp. NPDC091387]